MELSRRFWKLHTRHYGVLGTDMADLYVNYNELEASKNGGVWNRPSHRLDGPGPGSRPEAGMEDF